MQYTVFLQRLKKLTVIPQAYLRRAQDIAHDLSEGDRVALLRNLKDIAQDLKKADVLEQKYLRVAGKLLLETEKRLAMYQRGDREHAEQAEEMQFAESQLSQFSSYV